MSCVRVLFFLCKAPFSPESYSAKMKLQKHTLENTGVSEGQCHVENDFPRGRSLTAGLGLDLATPPPMLCCLVFVLHWRACSPLPRSLSRAASRAPFFRATVRTYSCTCTVRTYPTSYLLVLCSSRSPTRTAGTCTVRIIPPTSYLLVVCSSRRPTRRHDAPLACRS